MPAPETPKEARQRAAAERAILADHDRARRPAGRQSPGYLHTVHPDHGEPVVFVPGETLPDWAAQALDAYEAERQAALDAASRRRKDKP
jgi:hypothetical protein